MSMEQKDICRITLDFNKTENIQQTYEELKKQMTLPEYFGNNLDALHDCLTECAEPIELTLIPGEKKEESWVAAFGRVCMDAAEENSKISVEIR